MKTYGSILLRGSYWMIAPEPEAMIRLKRVFAGLDKGAADQVKIKRSPSVDMDLQWFMERYPFEIDDGHAREMHRGAETYREQQSMVGQVLADNYMPREFTLAIPPRNYQKLAADLWLKVQGLLLADEMGVGKSGSTMCGLTDKRALPALIAMPKQLLAQWRSNLATWMPGLRVHTLAGTKPYDIGAAMAKDELFAKVPKPSNAFPDVLLINYDRLEGWAPVLTGKVKAAIFDEIQALQHGPSTAKYRAAMQIAEAADFRLGLSGSPVHNYGGSFFWVCDILRPGALGSREEFVREHCVSDGDEKKARIKNPKAFGLHLRENGIMLRRTRKDVGLELPPVTVVPYHIDADAAELNKVKGKAAELARIILAQNDNGEGSGLRKMNAGARLSSILRHATGVAKAPFAAEYLRFMIESGERIVAGAWHIDVHDIIAEKLKDYAPAFVVGELDGRTMTDKQKEESFRRFKEGDTPLLMLSLRSAAGYDGLQYVCRNVVHIELDYAGVVHDQLRTRVDRPGQTDFVTETFLLTDMGSDPLITDIIGAKRMQSGPVLDPKIDTFTNSKINPAHMRKLAEMVLKGAR